MTNATSSNDGVRGRSIMSPAKAGFRYQFCHRTHSWRCRLLVYRRLRRLVMIVICLSLRQAGAQLRSQIADVGFFDDVEVGARDLVDVHAAAGQCAPAFDQIL